MLVLVVEPFPRRSPLLKRSFSSSGPVQVKAVSRLTDIASASPPPDVLVIELVDSAETARFLMARPDRLRNVPVMLLVEAETVRFEWLLREMGADSVQPLHTAGDELAGRIEAMLPSSGSRQKSVTR